MRIAVGLLTCLAAGALTCAFGDPATPPPATTPAPAASAAGKPTAQAPAVAPAAAAAASREELDQDTRHFLAEGFKPEIHGGQQLYCRKETVVGSRLSAVKNCGTIGELKLNEQRAKSGVYDAQRQQGH
jgi:hypothetical protein